MHSFKFRSDQEKGAAAREPGETMNRLSLISIRDYVLALYTHRTLLQLIEWPSEAFGLALASTVIAREMLLNRFSAC